MHAKPIVADRPTTGGGLALLRMGSLAVSLLLAACSNDAMQETPGKPLAAEPDTDTADSVADLADDALQAPLAPSLSISAAPGTLTFSWHSTRAGETGGLYHLDDLTGIETQVQAIDSAAGSLTLNVSSLALDWQHSRYRVSWCNGNDCVSSHYRNITGLSADALETLDGYTPSEPFAANRNGRLLAHLENGGNTLQIDLLSGGSGASLTRHAQSIELDWPDATPAQAMTLASDQSGDTLAALRIDAQSRLQLVAVDRLGETWIATSATNIALSQKVATRLDEARPMSLRNGDPSTGEVTAASGNARLAARYSAGGERLLVMFHDSDGHLGRLSLLLLTRDGFDWIVAHHQQLAPGANWLPTLSTDAALDTVYVAEQRADGVHLLELTISEGSENAPVPTDILIPATGDQVVMADSTHDDRLLVAWLENTPDTVTTLMQDFQLTESGSNRWQSGTGWRGPTVMANPDQASLGLSADRTLEHVVLDVDTDRNGSGQRTATLLTRSSADWRDTMMLAPAGPAVYLSADGSLLLSGQTLLR